MKLYIVPILIDIVSAYLTIQASTYSFERLLGDAAHKEGDRRQHVQDNVPEMLFMICSFVSSQIENI